MKLTVQIHLRQIVESDLEVFFEHQRDKEANYLVGFGAKNPDDKAAFMEKWKNILLSKAVVSRTIVMEGEVVGYVLTYELEGQVQLAYWIGREYWGKGITTQAVRQFLAQMRKRPIYGRVAFDHIASRKVMEKCGFKRVGKERGYANARGQEIEEWVLRLGE